MVSSGLAALSAQVTLAINDFAARLRSRYGPRVQELVLYGSQARGEASVDSDIDVFVHVEGLLERERGELFELAGQVSLDHLVTLQAFAPLPDELAWLRRYECRIMRDIDAEGVSL